MQLAETAPVGTLRDALARALGETNRPSSRTGFPPAAPTPTWTVDRSTRPPEESGRAVARVERGGTHIAALIHDPALNEDPELVNAVGAAAGLALENERLHAELRAKLDELRASRARIVRAGDEERRRLERNLHDGALQRLLALSFSVGLAESQVPEELEGVRGLVAEARQELGLALEELRELARGIHPTILTERGLLAALESLAARSAIPVTVSAPDERLPPAVEATAYYVVSEAVANATKYARATRLTVDVSRADGTLVVEVSRRRRRWRERRRRVPAARARRSCRRLEGAST